ncbi:MAG: hypothetical protein V4587_10120, partial [Acidobacteriota bacterium]
MRECTNVFLPEKRATRRPQEYGFLDSATPVKTRVNEGAMTSRAVANQISSNPETADSLASRRCLRLRLVWIALVLLPVACSLYLGLHNLRRSWDDGAITAAYARTFADSGRIALTPSSPQVEGMSSLTWLLLLSIPRFFFSNPDIILIWMKCASTVSLVL